VAGKTLARPMLIFQAEKDDFVSVKALQKFADKIKKSGEIAACEYISMPGQSMRFIAVGMRL